MTHIPRCFRHGILRVGVTATPEHEAGSVLRVTKAEIMCSNYKQAYTVNVAFSVNGTEIFTQAEQVRINTMKHKALQNSLHAAGNLGT
jgi:hypothetical protein